VKTQYSLNYSNRTYAIILEYCRWPLTEQSVQFTVPVMMLLLQDCGMYVYFYCVGLHSGDGVYQLSNSGTDLAVCPVCVSVGRICSVWCPSDGNCTDS